MPDATTLLSEVSISTRLRHGLEYHKCESVGDVTRLSARDIVKTKNLGNGSLAEVESLMAAYGLSLRKVKRFDGSPLESPVLSAPTAWAVWQLIGGTNA